MSIQEEDQLGKKIVLLCSDNSFAIPTNVAKYSVLLKSIIDGDDGACEIPIVQVKPPILQKVVEFLIHYETEPTLDNIPKPLKVDRIAEAVGEWYSSFVDVDLETLFELILAANYLEIRPLLNLTCATVALLVRGKTCDELRTMFNVTTQPIPVDEKELRANNPWIEEC